MPSTSHSTGPSNPPPLQIATVRTEPLGLRGKWVAAWTGGAAMAKSCCVHARKEKKKLGSCLLGVAVSQILTGFLSLNFHERGVPDLGYQIIRHSRSTQFNQCPQAPPNWTQCLCSRRRDWPPSPLSTCRDPLNGLGTSLPKPPVACRYGGFKIHCISTGARISTGLTSLR